MPEGFAGVLKLVDKPDLGSGAQAYGFESLHPHKGTASFEAVLFSILITH